VLVTCSCSQNVDAETFERIVAAGAKHAGRQVQIFERRGAASDHPLPPAFAEGQYLKVLLGYIY
jgi:23S rRNA (cytosine1962-C5)-methyltransferase